MLQVVEQLWVLEGLQFHLARLTTYIVVYVHSRRLRGFSVCLMEGDSNSDSQ